MAFPGSPRQDVESWGTHSGLLSPEEGGPWYANLSTAYWGHTKGEKSGLPKAAVAIIYKYP